MRHHMLADAVAIIGTMDLVFGYVFLSYYPTMRLIFSLFFIPVRSTGSIDYNVFGNWTSYKNYFLFITCFPNLDS